MLRDIALTPTTSYLQASALASADTDHIDIGLEMLNVTVTNDTDQTVTIKNTGKSTAPSGSGRTLVAGESFNFLKVNLSEFWLKAGDTPTGEVILTGYFKR